MSRIICCVQARLDSARFPRKVLADLNGRPLLWHVVSRAKRIPGVDRIVLAVPAWDRKEIEPALQGLCAAVYGHYGAEHDVLYRFRAVARWFDARIIMRLTADCPVLDPIVAGQALQLFERTHPCEFASNDTAASGYPDGWDVEVFSRHVLELAYDRVTDPHDKEHVTPWMKRHCAHQVLLRAPRPWTGPKKLSVDVPSDLEVVKAFMEAERAKASPWHK